MRAHSNNRLQQPRASDCIQNSEAFNSLVFHWLNVRPQCRRTVGTPLPFPAFEIRTTCSYTHFENNKKKSIVFALLLGREFHSAKPNGERVTICGSIYPSHLAHSCPFVLNHSYATAFERKLMLSLTDRMAFHVIDEYIGYLSLTKYTYNIMHSL